MPAAHAAAAALRDVAKAAKAADKKYDGDINAYNHAVQGTGLPGLIPLGAVVGAVETIWDRMHPSAPAAAPALPTSMYSGAYGASNEILDAITGQESGGAYNGPDSPTGARGRYQFEPDTAATYLPEWFKKRYGSDISSGAAARAWSANERGVQDIVAHGYYDMLNAHARKYGKPNNDAASIAAGWYGGVGGEDAWIRGDRKYLDKRYFQGGQWFPSIAQYVSDVMQREAAMARRNPDTVLDGTKRHARRPIQTPTKVHITITNKSGTSVASSANAAGVH